MRDGFENAAQDRRALIRNIFRDGERSHAKRAVADQIPVRAVAGPCAGCAGVLVDGQYGVERFGDDRIANRGALFRRERVVEPVVTDGEGTGHLGGIDEARGIPVFEGCGGIEFEHGAAQPGIAAGKPVHEGERGDAVDCVPGLGLQARPGELVLNGWDGQEPVAFFFEVAVYAPGDGVFAGQNADAVEIGIEQNQARVGGPELMERIVVRSGTLVRRTLIGLRKRRQAG